MKVFDKEFDELIEQFVKDSKYLIPAGHKMDRESKETVRKCKVFFCDGFVDSMFRAYMLGYQSHKCLTNLQN